MKWILLSVLLGCSQVTSLNLKKHEFGILPLRIIWFQIAGLEEEHLAMLRFQQSEERKTSFEENLCIGKTWGYNLYSIRPTAQYSFLSQLTGKKNVKSTCEDSELKPIWSYLIENGYNTGIFEIGANRSQSLLSMNDCGDKGKVFLKSTNFWTSQASVPGSTTFHYLEEIPMKQDTVFQDRSCNVHGCSSLINDNFGAIANRFNKSGSKSLLLIRDFSYLDALQKNDVIRARQILYDLEKTYASALAFAKSSNDFLVILTTGESKLVDMPDQGKAWYEFDKLGKNLNLKRTQLTNLVMATGSRAENFCGFYDDSDLFERILSGPKQQGLELKFINPFR